MLWKGKSAIRSNIYVEIVWNTARDTVPAVLSGILELKESLEDR